MDKIERSIILLMLLMFLWIMARPVLLDRRNLAALNKAINTQAQRIQQLETNLLAIKIEQQRLTAGTPAGQ